jgi:ribosomal protein S6
MAVMEEETKLYELGYLIKGDLPDEICLKTAEAVRKAIEDEKGLIISENQPKKQNLGYAVKGQETAYFGSLKFIFPTEKIPLFQKNLEKLNLLRIFLSKKKQEKEIVKRSLKRRPTRPGARKESSDLSSSTAPVKDEHQGEAIQVEEIDKKLEEILGQ